MGASEVFVSTLNVIISGVNIQLYASVMMIDFSRLFSKVRKGLLGISTFKEYKIALFASLF